MNQFLHELAQQAINAATDNRETAGTEAQLYRYKRDGWRIARSKRRHLSITVYYIWELGIYEYQFNTRKNEIIVHDFNEAYYWLSRLTGRIQ